MKILYICSDLIKQFVKQKDFLTVYCSADVFKYSLPQYAVFE